MMLGFDQAESDHEVLKKWKAASCRVCKPCWELKYCPYGPLVEDFPLLPTIRTEAIEHNNYLSQCIKTGTLGNEEKLDDARRNTFEEMIAEFNPKEYPESIPQSIADMSCNVFGHICPIVFVAEAFTETSEERRVGRYISFKTKVRVVRRDNYTCQHCNKHLNDDEVEFDHIIPVSKGGSSEEHNIRLTCFTCNRGKSDKIDI